MRAITIRQPHAWAIIHGGKDVENRSRNIAGTYRGPVAIHAGLAKYEQDNMSSRAHRAAHGTETPSVIVCGAIIGVGNLVDVHLDVDKGGMPCGGMDDMYRGHYCSPWAMPDHWHLTFDDMRPLATPIPYKGALGLWTLPDHVLDGAL